jgi:hypothetical protein
MCGRIFFLKCGNGHVYHLAAYGLSNIGAQRGVWREVLIWQGAQGMYGLVPRTLAPFHYVCFGLRVTKQCSHWELSLS